MHAKLTLSKRPVLRGQGDELLPLPAGFNAPGMGEACRFTWNEDDGEMVCCDGCEIWYHYDCLEGVGCVVPAAAVARLQWFCPEEECQQKNQLSKKQGDDSEDDNNEHEENDKEEEEGKEEEGEVNEVATQCTKRVCRKWRDVDRVLLARKRRDAAAAALPNYLFICKDGKRKCHGVCDHCNQKTCTCTCNECAFVGTKCTCPAYGE